jgi:hypothetical protein
MTIISKVYTYTWHHALVSREREKGRPFDVVFKGESID